MKWFRAPTTMMAAINDGSLLRFEYVLAENKILRKQNPGPVKMTDADRRTLAEFGKKLGRQALKEIGSIVTADTILGWYNKLIAKKFDGSKKKRGPGRPRRPGEIDARVLKFARENQSWAYGRIAGALANVGHEVSQNTVANILKKHRVEPAPTRNQGTPWADFIKSHLAVMAATDFFTAEVLTLKGLVTYYVRFFIEIGSGRVHPAVIRQDPDEASMMQVARSVTMEKYMCSRGSRARSWTAA